MTEQQLQQELEALRAENKFLKAQNAAISKELDDYIQNLSKSDFEKMLQENNKKRLIEELSDLTDDLMLETITTRDGETYDIYTCSVLTYDLINKTMKMLMKQFTNISLTSSAKQRGVNNGKRRYFYFFYKYGFINLLANRLFHWNRGQ